MEANGISDPTRLYPGQTLRIPGTGAVAVATPLPVPAATVPTTGSFTVRYFNNLAFTGTPALVQTEAPGTRHDWGLGAPGPGVRSDNFSALLDGQFEFEEGLHRFTVTVDDGMRLYVDDNLVREAWHDQAVTTYVVDVHLTAGTHQVRLEYYERANDATLWLRWLPLFPTTMPVPPTAPPVPAPGSGYYTDNDKRAMFQAIGQNDIGTVRQLIASSGFPHFHFDQNRTALHYAAFADALEIMALLLGYPDADPNVLYNHPNSSIWNRNRTPLHEASTNGHAGMAEMLLSHGADHWLVTGGGFTALHFAARNNHGQTVETLLRHGAAPNLRDDDNGYTPLHQIVTRRSESETLEVLLRDRRIRPNLRDYRGRTPLHIAAARGNTAQVAALLNHPDTNPNELDDRETTALYQAVAEGHEEVVEELLDHPDTDPDIEDRRGWTPLFRAVYEGNEDLVRELLRHNADTEINTEEGWSGLWYAETHGYHDIARLLRRHGATGALG